MAKKVKYITAMMCISNKNYVQSKNVYNIRNKFYIFYDESIISITLND